MESSSSFHSGDDSIKQQSIKSQLGPDNSNDDMQRISGAGNETMLISLSSSSSTTTKGTSEVATPFLNSNVMMEKGRQHHVTMNTTTQLSTSDHDVSSKGMLEMDERFVSLHQIRIAQRGTKNDDSTHLPPQHNNGEDNDTSPVSHNDIIKSPDKKTKVEVEQKDDHNNIRDMDPLLSSLAVILESSPKSLLTTRQSTEDVVIVKLSDANFSLKASNDDVDNPSSSSSILLPKMAAIVDYESSCKVNNEEGIIKESNIYETNTNDERLATHFAMMTSSSSSSSSASMTMTKTTTTTRSSSPTKQTSESSDSLTKMHTDDDNCRIDVAVDGAVAETQTSPDTDFVVNQEGTCNGIDPLSTALLVRQSQVHPKSHKASTDSTTNILIEIPSKFGSSTSNLSASKATAGANNSATAPSSFPAVNPTGTLEVDLAKEIDRLEVTLSILQGQQPQNGTTSDGTASPSRVSSQRQKPEEQKDLPSSPSPSISTANEENKGDNEEKATASPVQSDKQKEAPKESKKSVIIHDVADKSTTSTPITTSVLRQRSTATAAAAARTTSFATQKNYEEEADLLIKQEEERRHKERIQKLATSSDFSTSYFQNAMLAVVAVTADKIVSSVCCTCSNNDRDNIVGDDDESYYEGEEEEEAEQNPRHEKKE